ncbi:hypothetical protein [uncultured Kriegella sp.]|uniref:hypothetical protein n=1 Tax=uncultured Kriegella sp. TaxID=1798910 RepID=UPI0030DD8FA3|tara:strand:+ start:18018 stop:18386 length:369 start_codon:yes stop_codon:yes gene_type:complete
MKKTIKFLSVLMLVCTVVTSCSKDNDPVDDNIFIGTYNGSVSYSEEESNTDIVTDDGRVTLVKVGDSYNFDFSNGIPSLKGIKMDKNQNLLINSDGTVKIDEGTLIIAYTLDGETWTANCSR